MDEQVRIEEKAHFYTKKKEWVDQYAREKEKHGFKVRVVPAEPKGWIVVSTLWLGYSKCPYSNILKKNSDDCGIMEFCNDCEWWKDFIQR